MTNEEAIRKYYPENAERILELVRQNPYSEHYLQWKYTKDRAPLPFLFI